MRDAIEDGRVIDFDKNKRTELSVIAKQARLGDITEGSLKDSIARFRKEINDFKQKNKISYSRKAANRNHDKVYTKSDALGQSNNFSQEMIKYFKELKRDVDGNMIKSGVYHRKKRCSDRIVSMIQWT